MDEQIKMAVEAERNRYIAICQGWLEAFQHRRPQYVSAQDWACDAIKDIIDGISSNQSPHATLGN